MLHDMHFLVQPRQELQAQLESRVPREVADLLLEPVLVTQRHGCREVLLSDSFATRIKLLYLAALRDLDPLNADADAERVLGSSRISVAVFDRWWSIRRLREVESFETMSEYLSPLASKVDATGDEWVDGWIGSMGPA